MKFEKNYLFKRKNNFFLFKLILWFCVGAVYLGFSFIIPTNPNDSNHFVKELIVFTCMVLFVNIHASFLYPIISKTNKWIYLPVFISSILICAGLELFIYYDNFETSYCTFHNRGKIYLAAIIYLIIRDLAIFIFFLWVEYFNRLISLFYKKEKIHQEEILLLKEKQEFEKNYSRRFLLPHYFFNLLEHIQTKLFTTKYDSELLDCFKFILYYFLVDSEKDTVELDKEVMFYKYYIELEKIKHQNVIAVRFVVLGQTENFFIIPLLFEPIIGNAMKYTKQDGTGWVEIEFDITNSSFLKFICKNNFSESNNNIVSSESGLKILIERLELFYKNKYSYSVNKTVDLYEATLSLVLK